jgi:hypothetical protein
LATDYDLALVTVAGSVERDYLELEHLFANEEEDEDIWKEFAAWVRNQLSTQELRAPLIIRGIMSSSDGGSRELTSHCLF